MNRDMEPIAGWCSALAAGYSADILTADKAISPGQSDDYIALGWLAGDPALTAGNHDPAFGGHGTFSGA